MSRFVNVAAAQLGPIARNETKKQVVDRLLAHLHQAKKMDVDVVVDLLLLLLEPPAPGRGMVVVRLRSLVPSPGNGTPGMGLGFWLPPIPGRAGVGMAGGGAAPV